MLLFVRLLAVLAGLIATPLVILVVLVLVGVVHLYRIPSAAMEPTLHCARPASLCEARFSDRIATIRYLFWSPSRGDIVAFTTPPLAAQRCGEGGTFVKRVIGLPGDRFAERDGFVYIDGEKLVEPYLRPASRDTRTIPPRLVPDGQYYLLGDNRGASCDSRTFGPVPKKDLKGRVFATYWPPNRITVR